MPAPRKPKGEKKVPFVISIEEKYLDGKDPIKLKEIAVKAIKRVKI